MIYVCICGEICKFDKELGGRKSKLALKLSFWQKFLHMLFTLKISIVQAFLGKLTSQILFLSLMAIWVILWYFNISECILTMPQRERTFKKKKKKHTWAEREEWEGKAGAPLGRSSAGFKGTGSAFSEARRALPAAGAAEEGARQPPPCSLAAGRALRGRRDAGPWVRARPPPCVGGSGRGPPRYC